MTFYKKALKIKFGFMGEKHDQVLDLQYKISCVKIADNNYLEAEEILNSVCTVVVKEKSKQPKVDKFYRYGVYFYTLGFSQLKNGKKKKAVGNLEKAKLMWQDIMHSDDQALKSVTELLAMCD